MKAIKKLQFPKIRNVEFNGVEPFDKRYFKINLYLYLGDDNDEEYADDPSLKIELGFESITISMPEMLEPRYIPQFSIHSDCFLEECVLEGHTFKSTFEALAAMALAKAGNPKVTLTKEEDKLIVTFTVQDFSTEKIVNFRELENFFK